MGPFGLRPAPASAHAVYALPHFQRVPRAAEEERVRVQQGQVGLELIVDETLASVYLRNSSGEDAGGPSVWDALAVPVLALPMTRPRVLILGLGGGTVARLLRRLKPEAILVGVEMDGEVIAAAKEFFDLEALQVEVVHQDGLAFLREEKRHFDLIIDDIFVGYARNLRKPRWLPWPGLRLARRRLRPGGLLVSNALEDAKYIQQGLQGWKRALLQLEVPDYANRILVAGPSQRIAQLETAAPNFRCSRPGRVLWTTPRFLKESRFLRLSRVALSLAAGFLLRWPDKRRGLKSRSAGCSGGGR
ncbi:unnamed protein product [Effrenium voratum]|nr:unnamed protein product [Effrenium voratum]